MCTMWQTNKLEKQETKATSFTSKFILYVWYLHVRPRGKISVSKIKAVIGRKTIGGPYSKWVNQVAWYIVVKSNFKRLCMGISFLVDISVTTKTNELWLTWSVACVVVVPWYKFLENRRNVFTFLPGNSNDTCNTRDIGQKRNSHTKSLKNSISQRRIWSEATWFTHLEPGSPCGKTKEKWAWKYPKIPL